MIDSKNIPIITRTIPIKYLNENGSFNNNIDMTITKSIDSALKTGCAIFKLVFDKTKP